MLIAIAEQSCPKILEILKNFAITEEHFHIIQKLFKSLKILRTSRITIIEFFAIFDYFRCFLVGAKGRY